MLAYYYMFVFFNFLLLLLLLGVGVSTVSFSFIFTARERERESGAVDRLLTALSVLSWHGVFLVSIPKFLLKLTNTTQVFEKQH